MQQMQQMQQREISNYANRYFSLYRNFGERWACCDCDCTEELEQRLASQGEPVSGIATFEPAATVSTKHQRNSKLQPPKTWEVIGWSLKIGASLGFGGWDLELTTTHLHIMMRRFVP